MVQDESPIKFTCPLINRVIEWLNEPDDSKKRSKEYILGILETLRESNTKLREWGNMTAYKLNDAQMAIDEQRDHIRLLMKEISESQKSPDEKS